MARFKQRIDVWNKLFDLFSNNLITFYKYDIRLAPNPSPRTAPPRLIAGGPHRH